MAKHVPLIRFLGPRKFLAHAGAGAATPAAGRAAAAPQVAVSNGVRIVTYESEFALPPRYRQLPLSAKELAAIDAGGADHIVTGA
ncbi:hypothetical protein BC831DRAFT_474124 [Entophlyctis helioformis]|nr:hypothetical protein BC831DRAFT_474124 [Entophlyctis helioformis]